MEEKKGTFSCTNSAAQQDEVKRIREKYAPSTQTEDKLEQLRKLDRNVIRPGRMAALVVGLVSTLIMGVGMCCTLVWAESFFILGIVIGIVGIIGIIGICSAYPMYAHITKRRRDKLSPEIIRLTDELMK